MIIAQTGGGDLNFLTANMKRIRLSKHAQEQALERGATEAEVNEAVRKVRAT